MEVGMCHPPVGLNLYVASGITKMGITELTVAVWPLLLSMFGFLVVVTYAGTVAGSRACSACCERQFISNWPFGFTAEGANFFG